jgi:endonuclease YncB( thermonuclease family)
VSAAVLLCLVIGVADGDTLNVRCEVGGAKQNMALRLAQIDAPETTDGQPYSTSARGLLRKLCFKQQAEVTLTGKVTYKRKVAEVKCRGEDVSPKLLTAGLAWAYPEYVKDPAVFELEAAARAAKVGLWSSSKPIPPWEWRQGKR